MSAINTPYATLSFANIFTPRPRAEGGAPVYSCSLIFDPTQQKSPAYKALQDACIAGRPQGVGRQRPPQGASRCRSATPGRRSYDGYHAGHTFISPWSKNKPGVVDTNRQDILVPEEVWSGQLVRANVVPFAWTHTGKQGRLLRPEPSSDHPVRRPSAARWPPLCRSAFDDGEVKEKEDVPF